MSFFFDKKKQAPKRPKTAQRALFSGTAPRSAKQDAAVLNRLSCKACALNTQASICTPKMPPTLARDTLVYFLAESPDEHEDEISGQPLTGPAGKLLRECIPSNELRKCSFDNIIRDRPPKNRTPTWNEIECCRPNVTKSIEAAKPRLIVGLGAVPLHQMLNSKDVAGMRGRMFTVKVGNHTCFFMPTYHPSFLLKVAYDKKKPLKSKFGHCFKMDVKWAFKFANGAQRAPRVNTALEVRSHIQCFDGSHDTHFEKVMGLLKVAKQATHKAVDIETKGLRPYRADAAIMSIALSFEDQHFSFAWAHPKCRFTDQQKLKMGAELQRVLRDDTIKIAHNSIFELEWFIWLYGKDAVNHAAWEDTQVQAHFLDERRGKQSGRDDERRATYQSLDFLCKQHFGIAYKSVFKLNKKDMSQSDLGETLIYNAADTKYTLRLFYRQQELLKQQGLHAAYHEALPRQASVALMQALGVCVDQKVVKAFQVKLGGEGADGSLTGEIGNVLGQIKELKVVKAYIRDKGSFNPQGDDAVALFRDYLKCKEVTIEEANGTRYSIDKGVLDQIDHPLANLIIQLRNKTKLKNTYVDVLELGAKDSVVFPDGKIHCNFNTTFTETGRTSSDSPNAQNIPQRNDAWVRSQIVAPQGHVLVAFDYGQLEACTAAMCSRDPVLVQALWDDYDIHMEWAVKLADKLVKQGLDQAIIQGSMRDPKVAKRFRSIVKNKLVFPAIFGAQASSIAGYLNMPEDIADDLMEEFWAKFHGLYRWQSALMKKYYDEGYVESPTGRRHRYPLTRNQAINFPVQSFACDIVCQAMNELSFIATTQGKWHLHPVLNIHDDLSFCIPDKDAILEDAINTIYRIMLKAPYKEVNVPLSVSCLVGPCWFGMQDVGKFWSHKDL